MTASVDRIGTNVNDLNREVADMRVREQRTADAIDCLVKWLIGGASTLLLTQFDRMIANYAPVLKSIGIMDESGNLDIDKAETFVNSAFGKQDKVRVPFMGVPITFDKSDGDALIRIFREQAGE